jgi:hypothetical protein
MIAKVDAPRPPAKHFWDLTDEEIAEQHRRELGINSRQSADEMLRYWTGRDPLPVPPQQDSIQARFERFHAANPHIYARLVEAARRLKTAGKTKIGIGHLVEDVVRWAEERTSTGETWKISNDYRSRYARLIMEQEPDLRGVFEIRQLESA